MNIDLEAARRHVALCDQNDTVETSTRLKRMPDQASPVELREPKYVTERPFLEKNKRYKPFSLR